MTQPTRRGDLRESKAGALRAMSRMSLRSWALALIVLAIAERFVRYSLNFPLWGDEGFVAVNFIETSYADLIRPLWYNQIVPLGFMWATRALVDLLGSSEYALRLLPFAAGVAVIPL